MSNGRHWENSKAISSALDTLQQRVRELERENEALEEQIEGQEVELLQAKDCSLSERLSAKRDLDSRVRSLQYSAEQLESEKSSFQAKEQLAQDKITKLQSHISALEEGLLEPIVTTHEADLSSQLKDQLARQTAYEAQLKALVAQTQAVDKELEALRDDNSYLVQMIQTRKSEISGVKQAFERLAQTVTQETETWEKAENEQIQPLKASAAQLQITCKVLTQRDQSLDEELSSLMSEIGVLKEASITRKTSLHIPESPPSEAGIAGLEGEIRVLARQLQKALRDVDSPSKAEAAGELVRSLTLQIEEKTHELGRIKRKKQEKIRCQVLDSL